MIELFYFIFVVLVAIALGQRILRLIGVKFDSNLLNFIFSFPLGLAILAYVIFFIGIIGLLYKSIFISILLLLFILLIKDIIKIILILFQSTKNIKKIIKKLRFNFFTILVLFLSLFVVLNFIISFSPPWNYDVLAYHLAVPKIYIENHKIIYIPYILFSFFPSLIDFVSLMGLLLHSAILSHLFAYALSVTLILAIYSFCKKFFNTRIAILASLIFYSFPMVIEYISTAFIDIQLGLYVFLSIYGLFMYFHLKKNSWLFLSAIFIGIVISSKVLGILAFAGILAILVYNLFSRLIKKEINFHTLFYKILVFCLIAFIITMPWLLKSYFFTGNPVWPTLNSFFGGKYWNEEQQDTLTNLLLGREVSLINYVRQPWDLHVQIVEWQDGFEWRKRNFYEGEYFGPFLAFLPLYFFFRKKNKILNAFFIFILIFVTLLFFIINSGRYFLYFAPLIAIISAYVIMELFKNKYISKILKILLIFTFSFNLLIWFGGNTKDIVVALGFESEDSFYERQAPIHKPSKFINSNLPENSRILLFRDGKGFFLERDYIVADPWQAYIDYSKLENEKDYYEELKKLGITHVLVNNGSLATYRGFTVKEGLYTEKFASLSYNLLEKYTTNIYNEDNWLINEIK